MHSKRIKKWQSWLLQIHLYLGLLCVPYLLIYSISSLNFNHHFLAKGEAKEKGKSTTIHLDISMTDSPKASATIFQDSLNLMGWFIPWRSRQDTSGYHVELTHFGKSYAFEGQWGQKDIQFTVRNNPFGSILYGLHGLGSEIPNAPFWINIWQYYQDITVYSLLFWTISGVLLVSFRQKNRRANMLFLLASVLISSFILFYLWLIG